MSDKEKKDEDARKRKPQRVTEGIDFSRCPIHGVSYPKGGQCPLCEKNKNK